MKKILSLGAAAAVLSLTAVAASAAITPKFSTDAPVAGDTIKVEIVAEGMTQNATQFTVVASDNLTLTDNDPGVGYYSTATNRFTWAAAKVPADGTVLLTLTYTVDAAADDEISVSLVPDEGFADISGEPVAVVVVDEAGSDVSVEEPTIEEPTTEEPTDETVTTDEGGLTDVSSEEGSSENGGDNGNTGNNGETNPPTGVALAVVPAVLAGAAIVVAKKRK